MCHVYSLPKIIGGKKKRHVSGSFIQNSASHTKFDLTNLEPFSCVYSPTVEHYRAQFITYVCPYAFEFHDLHNTSTYRFAVKQVLNAIFSFLKTKFLLRFCKNITRFSFLWTSLKLSKLMLINVTFKINDFELIYHNNQ